MKWNIIHLDETDSTNRWLREHGVGDMVVVADYQTAGRGCGTNRWESERGRNLLFSVLLHPTDVPAARQFCISQAVAVTLCETLEEYLGEDRVQVKWPNDIYVGGRKIAGILIENRLQQGCIKDSIVGIGLNVNQWQFVSDAPNPVSLCQLLGHEVDREELLMRILRRNTMYSYKEYDVFSAGKRWFLIGKPALFQDRDGRFTATITGVEPDGRLVMTDAGGRERRYGFKEVQFVLDSWNTDMPE